MSSPAPHTSEPTTAKQDIPIDPKVGALFDEIKLFVVSACTSGTPQKDALIIITLVHDPILISVHAPYGSGQF